MADTNQKDSEDLLANYRQLDHKFRSACQQLVVLNNKIDSLQIRYDRAMKMDRRSFRYTLRLSLATMEGLRNMFYEYACRRGDELDALQEQLAQAGLLDDSNEDRYSNESEEDAITMDWQT